MIKSDSERLQLTVDKYAANEARRICDEVIGIPLSSVVNGCLFALIRENGIPYRATCAVVAEETRLSKEAAKDKKREAKEFERLAQKIKAKQTVSNTNENLICPKCGHSMIKIDDYGFWLCRFHPDEESDEICGNFFVYDLNKYNAYIDRQNIAVAEKNKLKVHFTIPKQEEKVEIKDESNKCVDTIEYEDDGYGYC